MKNKKKNEKGQKRKERCAKERKIAQETNKTNN